MDRGQVVLGALLDPLHRPTEPARDGEADRLLCVDIELRAEAASDVGSDHAQLGLRDAERERERDLRDVRDLRRRPHRELAHRRRRLHDHTARLDRVRDQPRMPVTLFDRHSGVVEEPLGCVGVAEAPRVRPVVTQILVDRRRVVFQRIFELEDGIERVVLDVDELERVLHVGARFCNDDGDAVAGEACLVRRERPLGRHACVFVGRRRKASRLDRPCTWKRGSPVLLQVRAAECSDHAFVFTRTREIDAADACVCVRAPDDADPHHSRQNDVVDELRLAGQQLGVLLAQDAAADVFLRFCGGSFQRLGHA